MFCILVCSAESIQSLNGTAVQIREEQNLILQWRIPPKNENSDLVTVLVSRGEKPNKQNLASAGNINSLKITEAFDEIYEGRMTISGSNGIVTLALEYVNGKDSGKYNVFAAYAETIPLKSTVTFTVEGKELCCIIQKCFICKCMN